MLRQTVQLLLLLLLLMMMMMMTLDASTAPTVLTCT